VIESALMSRSTIWVGLPSTFTIENVV